MTHTKPQKLIAELTADQDAQTATSLDEVRACPGRVYEVGEESYFFYLEALPPQFMDASVFCFAEGAEPYLLFWKRRGRYFARQLTCDETVLLAQLAGMPPPGDW